MRPCVEQCPHIFRQVFAWKGVWEEVLQNIKWNELKMTRLDIFAQNIEHQPKMRSRIIMKEAFNND